MKKRKIFIQPVYFILFIVLISLIISFRFHLNTALADGIAISGLGDFLRTPAQKAVVVWDDNLKKETLVLTTSFGIDSISSFCWVVPILSTQDPTVDAANNGIFNYLKSIFPSGKTPPSPYFGSDQNKIPELKVIEIKEIDVYDLAVIWANDSSILTDWLNNNGYSISSNSFTQVIKQYTDAQNGCYFIANKIDIKNVYANELAAFESYCRDKEGVNKGSDLYDLLMGAFGGTPSIKSIKEDLAELLLAEDIINGVSYDKYTFIGYLMTRTEYEHLQNKWQNGEISQFALETKLMEFINAFDLFKTIENLFNAAGTPIEVTFYPKSPIYPLYLTSLAENNGKIFVYVIAPTKVEDKYNLLKRFRSIELSSAHKTKLQGLGLSMPGGKYITLLTYEGDLTNLDEDAIFISYYGPEATTSYNPITPYYPWSWQPVFPIYPMSPIIPTNPFNPLNIYPMNPMSPIGPMNLFYPINTINRFNTFNPYSFGWNNPSYSSSTGTLFPWPTNPPGVNHPLGQILNWPWNQAFDTWTPYGYLSPFNSGLSTKFF